MKEVGCSFKTKMKMKKEMEKIRATQMKKIQHSRMAIMTTALKTLMMSPTSQKPMKKNPPAKSKVKAIARVFPGTNLKEKLMTRTDKLQLDATRTMTKEVVPRTREEDEFITRRLIH